MSADASLLVTRRRGGDMLQRALTVIATDNTATPLNAPADRLLERPGALHPPDHAAPPPRPAEPGELP